MTLERSLDKAIFWKVPQMALFRHRLYKVLSSMFINGYSF